MKFRKKILIILTVLLNVQAVNALNLDSMFKVADEKGNGIFIVSNENKRTEYVLAKVTKILVTNGEIKKVELTKDNLPLWDLAVLPARLILNPNEKKRVAIKNLCQKNCNRESDLVYQITFSPNLEAIEQNVHNVGILYSYAPYYIIPALKSDVKYQFEYKAGRLKVKNSGNTFIKFKIDDCVKGVQVEVDRRCKASYTLLAGRYLDIDIPERLRKDTLKIKVANYDQTYYQTINVKSK